MSPVRSLPSSFVRLSFIRLSFTVMSFAAALIGTPVRAGTVPVSNAAQLRTAIDAAQAGDEIVLAAGTYTISANLICDAIGNAGAPIIVRAATPRTALIRSSAVEGFVITGPHWQLRDLDIEGICADDDDCEHAVHIKSTADFTVLRGNHLRDFNAQVKSNGEPIASVYVFPDDVLIEHNAFYDTRPRATDLPVTKIDVVGGRRWIVRANTIYDFEKAEGNRTSYAAFLKGNSRNGTFERNLVVCERFFSGGFRVGLSLGGGGTGAAFCEDATCPPEHQNGVVRNNIIMNCPDVGIYLNAATNTLVDHNTLYDTVGIDVRFVESTATVRNNVMDGQIRNRDAGTSTAQSNIVGAALATLNAWFDDPATLDFGLVDGTSIVNLGVATPVTNDFCGNLRDDGQPDRGAIEYDGVPTCDTSIGGGGTAPPIAVLFANGFEN